jgi:hypothetical protein
MVAGTLSARCIGTARCYIAEHRVENAATTPEAMSRCRKAGQNLIERQLHQEGYHSNRAESKSGLKENSH